MGKYKGYTEYAIGYRISHQSGLAGVCNVDCVGAVACDGHAGVPVPSGAASVSGACSGEPGGSHEVDSNSISGCDEPEAWDSRAGRESGDFREARRIRKDLGQGGPAGDPQIRI